MSERVALHAPRARKLAAALHGAAQDIIEVNRRLDGLTTQIGHGVTAGIPPLVGWWLSGASVDLRRRIDLLEHLDASLGGAAGCSTTPWFAADLDRVDGALRRADDVVGALANGADPAVVVATAMWLGEADPGEVVAFLYRLGAARTAEMMYLLRRGERYLFDGRWDMRSRMASMHVDDAHAALASVLEERGHESSRVAARGEGRVWGRWAREWVESGDTAPFADWQHVGAWVQASRLSPTKLVGFYNALGPTALAQVPDEVRGSYLRVGPWGPREPQWAIDVVREVVGGVGDVAPTIGAEGGLRREYAAVVADAARLLNARGGLSEREDHALLELQQMATTADLAGDAATAARWTRGIEILGDVASAVDAAVLVDKGMYHGWTSPEFTQEAGRQLIAYGAAAIHPAAGAAVVALILIDSFLPPQRHDSHVLDDINPRVPPPAPRRG